METPRNQSRRGLRIHDLAGLVVGYSLAALLARSYGRPGSLPNEYGSAVVLALAFIWMGLAMSGPILLLLDRRGGPSPSTNEKSRRPARPGRLISHAPPVGRAVEPTTAKALSRYTRAELAWIGIGGYWIALTLFGVAAFSGEAPWALVGLLQVIAALGFWQFAPIRPTSVPFTHSWTHPAALVLLWTWPIAWICLILLSRS